MLFSVSSYDKSRKVSERMYSFNDAYFDENISVKRIVQSNDSDGSIKSQIIFTVRKNFKKPSSIGLVFNEDDWTWKNYVFSPAALYNGNRFTSLCKQYPPMLEKFETIKYAGETVISDVPRLSKDGNGTVQLEVGDMATPCIGWFSEKSRKGFLLFFEQKNELGNFGITVKENADEKKAQFILSSPCVREETTYGMCTTREKSTDCGAELKKGDTVTFNITEYRFDCNSITDFHNIFFDFRSKHNLPKKQSDVVPWSYAWEIIEEKYNKRNWVEKEGFYKSSEATASIYRQWQTGWVGGGMNTLPGIILGNSESTDKSCKTLDFIFDKLQHRSGFLYGVYCDGRPYGDDFHNPENADIVMSRKNADALYYLIKHLIYLKKNRIEISEKWDRGVQKLADAFLSFCRKNCELGQFIDIEREKLYISGSSSAGMAPAGLALCGQYYNNTEYTSAAQEIAQSYYDNYILKGYTNGGPGEILSSPDSESAFGLLESYVTLYSCTEDKKWLKYAEDTASICAGWCVSYDYQYKKNTQFYKRGVSTAGAVWANVQNKHAAPGICTLSGSSLFRLYRATGDMKYLSLCRDIAHSITQFVSIPDNPIYASYVWHNKNADFQKNITNLLAKASLQLSKKLSLPLSGMFNKIGRMNERINLSDWEGKNNVGEVPHGSCWCEVSTMLTFLEIPAVYIQSDTGFCYALDHVKCDAVKNEKGLAVKLTNPTPYDANYRLYIENDSDRKNPIKDMTAEEFKTVCVKAHETIIINI